ncbi:unnamed protein product [Sphagnum troendelagicum]|uniref:Uncharacterized protein n=1 Tax=Sphagnum troendelagicum TaxID=128251 RepID=A0ABP0UXW1_9BRYO
MTVTTITPNTTHCPSPALVPTVINGTAVPHWSANYDGLLLSSSTVRKRQRASVSELRQRSVPSLFPFLDCQGVLSESFGQRTPNTYVSTLAGFERTTLVLW